MTILDKIIANKKKEIALAKKRRPLSLLKRDIKEADVKMRKFKKTNRLQLIAEIKAKSPSSGIIRKSFNVRSLSKHFQIQGASAVSVLTDKKYFGGSLKNLSLAKQATKLPILRKDFVCDVYQLYEAKSAGADLVLLIVAVLKNRLKDFVRQSLALGLQPLIEVHNTAELKIVLQSVKPNSEIIIGVNNRNLKTFQVDLDNSVKLVKMIPKEFIRISESGIFEVHELALLSQAGFDGVLIGGGLAKNPRLFKYFKKI